jgi:hypothetical protein
MNAAAMIGSCDVLFVTLDTLRYDVAVETMDAGHTPFLREVIPGGQWELRHSPGSFTYAAHQAFFAGFLPTPATTGAHERLFAARFAGSETTGTETAVFDAADIVTGLASAGYHTACIGGVGFFNKRTPLGSVLPSLFAESHWNEALGVTAPDSTQRQVELAQAILEKLPPERRLMMFLNVSAIHQPNCIYVPGAGYDDKRTMAAALAYVDPWLGRLFDAARRRRSVLTIICSDHGTAYGEDGFWGHRIAHPVVWNVPYAEFVLEKRP